MSDKTQTLQTQYVQQVAADLKRNVGEQERINSEITALQNRLEVLKRDGELLEGMQSALGGAATPAAKPAKPAAVPKARRAKGSVSAETTKTAIKTTAKSAKKPVNAKAVAPARGATPSLREVVVTLLGQHHEPRSAAEVSAELEKAQPERAVNVTLVRNALEASVAKNQSTRTKQGKFVYYTALTEDAAAAQAGAATSDANA